MRGADLHMPRRAAEEGSFRDKAPTVQFGKSRSQGSPNIPNCISPHSDPPGWFIRGGGNQDGLDDAGWFSECVWRLGCELSEEGANRRRVGFVGLHAVGGRREVRGHDPGSHDRHLDSGRNKVQGESFHCQLDCSLPGGVDTRTRPGDFA